MTVDMDQNKLGVDGLSLGDGIKVVYNPRQPSRPLFFI